MTLEELKTKFYPDYAEGDVEETFQNIFETYLLLQDAFNVCDNIFLEARRILGVGEGESLLKKCQEYADRGKI